MYQKTYTTDSLPLKRYLNTGQRSKYYAMETHEGIISKTDYEKVQNLLAKKSITGEIDRTCVFSKKIYCSICGAICSRKGPPTHAAGEIDLDYALSVITSYRGLFKDVTSDAFLEKMLDEFVLSRPALEA